jgi:hypothetical protein
MKSLFIEYFPDLDKTDIATASEILEKNGAKAAIESQNWAKDFPYKPIAYFHIARSKEAVFIKFFVFCNALRAIYSHDQEPVYEDSCVEFFCKPVESAKYTNFEFNCIGTCSASRRKGRNEEVEPFSAAEMKSIERFPSIAPHPFEEIKGNFDWELIVKIPFKLMGIDPNDLPEKMLGNFYKCADGTELPHYLSWNLIQTEKPDFHRPEFFGELFLK